MNMINNKAARMLRNALLMGTLIPMGACSDWDNHYNPSEGDAANETVLQMMKENPDLSTFVKMVEIAGMEEVLDNTQTFSVWAPVNEALAGVDLSNVDEVKRIVSNHVARYNISSSTSPEKSVRMYNGKVNRFDGMTFAGVEMLSSDLRARNGVLHILKEAIPYRYNLREYIDTHPECSLMAAFIARFDEQKFDEEASSPLDVDENGNTVYDSVKVAYNRLFEDPVYGLGSIAAEDSVFTMLIPDNKAWTEAYARISPYFKNYNADQAVADSLKDVQTSLAIVSDLIFRKEIKDPASEGPLLTTSGSRIPDLASMFMGADRMDASNGMIYLTSSLNLDPAATFHKPLDVEAEEVHGRSTAAGTNAYTRVVGSDSEFFNQVSDNGYIEVSASSVSRNPGVTFQIPNVRSGKYDIYATFVPYAIDNAPNDSTKLSFSLTYRNEQGRNTSKTFSDNSFVTSGTKMKSIRIAEAFEFPVSDYADNMWLADPLNDPLQRTATTTLYVTTSMTSSEFNNGIYTRHFRIDRIYLVPVIE